MLDNLDLPEGTRVLDFGGNQFKTYCDRNNFIYKNGTGGYFASGLTYDGRNIPLEIGSFDVIIISFVLHHTSSNCIY